MTLGAVTPPTDGWYAVNRGRLCLGLEQSATDSSVFTWGDAPNSSVLTLTNSVRIKLNSDSAEAAGATDPSALQLSLLAPDRSDIPNLSEITGATIGIWQVDDSTTSGVGMIGDADLTICYDSLLANAFGATQNSVELWTFNAPDDTWSEVDPATFALDTVDHLVYGSAQDFSYFAVSAPPAPDANVLFVRANQLASISDPAGDSSQPPAGTQVVPEPTGLALLALGAGLLGRRRRSKR
jgi:hypothetical protein